MIVYHPRLPKANRGRVLSQMALNSDLASTMIELAGETPPAAHTGHSLMPLIQGETPSDWRTDFLCEFLAVPNTIPKWEGVRDTRWSYARYYVSGPESQPFEFLHDLRTDPDQLTNIAALPEFDRSNVQETALQKMRSRCDELIAQNGPTMKDMPINAQPQRKKQATRN